VPGRGVLEAVRRRWVYHLAMTEETDHAEARLRMLRVLLEGVGRFDDLVAAIRRAEGRADLPRVIAAEFQCSEEDARILFEIRITRFLLNDEIENLKLEIAEIEEFLAEATGSGS
jgi:DNA gyrase/topoisomerase IV subunit A